MPGHELSQVIRQIRETRGLSKSAFGRVVGVDHSVVSRWETGQRRPSLDTLRHLAVMLRLSAGERLALAVAAIGWPDGALDYGTATTRGYATSTALGEGGWARIWVTAEEAWDLAALLVTTAMDSGREQFRDVDLRLVTEGQSS